MNVYLFFGTECEYNQVKRIGNGICEDDVNVEECHYDGGDCCEPDSNINFCDDCLCIKPHDKETEEWVSECPWYPWLAGDGNCDDFLNHKGCHYDKGDCCDGSHYYCEDCFCLIPSGDALEVTANCSHPELIHDGQCDDDANVLECGLDGGDCCGSESSYYNYCEECTCILPDWPGVTPKIFFYYDWAAMKANVPVKNYSPCYEVEGKCYYFVSEKFNHLDAQLFCQDELDGILFEPKTIKINDEIFNAAVEYFEQENARIWIGIDDLEYEGHFVYSSDGAPLEFENWAKNQPNDMGWSGEDCVDYRAFWYMGFWLDSNCEDKIKSICEVTLEPSFNATTTMLPNVTTPTPAIILNATYSVTSTPIADLNTTLSVTPTSVGNVTTTWNSTSAETTTELSMTATTDNSTALNSSSTTSTMHPYPMTCSEIDGMTVCN